MPYIEPEPSHIPAVTQLKTEANDFYGQKKYPDAIMKYTGAIRLAQAPEFDGRALAVLYSNRGMCHSLLGHLEDAEADAVKATQLDPSYSKAWARLAGVEDSIQCYARAVKSWQRALDVLSSEESTGPPMALRYQCRTSIDISREKAAAQKDSEENLSKLGYQVTTPAGQAPWYRAEKLLPSLRESSDKRSSLWSIVEARKKFVKGTNELRKDPQRYTYVASGWMSLTPRAGTPRFEDILNISDAILLNERAFTVYDSEYSKKIEAIIMYYIKSGGMYTGSFHINDGWDTIVATANTMLEQHGWDYVRPRIAIAIRSLVVFSHDNLRVDRDYESAFLHLHKALQIIGWGRNHNSTMDIPIEDRGVVFDDIFFISVRVRLMIIYQQAYVAGMTVKFSLESLLGGVEILKNDAKDVDAEYIPGALNVCQELQLIEYPRAYAFSVEGFAYQQYHSAGECKNIEDSRMHFRKAHDCYLKAAELYPKDDEYHTFMLKLALDCLLTIEAPLSETIPLAVRVTKAAEMMLPIWEFSTLMQHGSTLSPHGPLKKQLEDVVAYTKGSLRPTWITPLSAPS